MTIFSAPLMPLMVSVLCAGLGKTDNLSRVAAVRRAALSVLVAAPPEMVRVTVLEITLGQEPLVTSRRHCRPFWVVALTVFCRVVVVEPVTAPSGQEPSASVNQADPVLDSH